jgi:hypothetical protein
VRVVEVDLPVEIVWRRAGDEIVLFGDVPRTVTRTAFDLPPARLHVAWAREEVS